MAFISTLVVLLGLSCSALGEVKFALRDCAHNKASELMTFASAHLSPYPVTIPGDLHVTAALRINKEASGDHSVDVTIERYIGFLWITVPCISNVGSCTYKSACGMLSGSYGNGTNTACPPEIRATGMPCTCPIPAGTYSMANTVFKIPELTGVWSWLASGDYRVTAKLIDNPTGQEIACQQVEATIVDGHPSCSGFLCSIFG
ncbi:hypothetical protein ACOMHN_021658 [Nucella lapillus]